jgi:RND family efflux transporter MFP subunit
VRAAQAQAEAAQGGIGQARAGVEEARAGVAGVATTRGYTEIRSLMNGVVTQRRISPGTLVQPGQTILQVAQINPIRLQANVAEADLKRVCVGSPFIIRDQSGSGKGKTIAARVSSIAPAVDPQTRTGLVEAVVPNADSRFLPGEYVVMEIETGQSRSNLTVPTVAIQQRAGATGETLATQAQSFVWVAEPVEGQTNQFTVRRVEVRTGVSDGATVEVLSGLQEGKRVVTAGYQYLKDGDIVATAGAVLAHSSEAMPPTPDMEETQGVRSNSTVLPAQTASVSVTEQGFVPVNVTLRGGVPARIIFTRKTDATCATAVVFPDFKIKKALPLGKPVVIEFTPKKNSEIVFGCDQDLMLRGKVVAR